MIKTSDKLPELGQMIRFKDRDGNVYTGIRTETSFYSCGYCYEDVTTRDHEASDVVEWEPMGQ